MTEILDTTEITTGDDPVWSIIWLHGLGADGHDFEPIVPELDLKGLPAGRFIFPHAPTRPVTINGGMVMRAWYDIYLANEIGGGIFKGNEQDIKKSAEQLKALIAREQERGIQPQNIILAGFSQGGAIALYTGLRFKETLAGILALSTYLPIPDTLKAEKSAANESIPIFMAHGLMDTTIPISVAKNSRDVMTAAGSTIQWQQYAMAHSVNGEEINAISQWLNKIISAMQIG